MNLTSRFFRWEDIPALHVLISEKWRREGPRVTLHVGDFYWRLRPRPGHEPTRDIRLWHHGDGYLAGFAWWEEPQGTGGAGTHRTGDGVSHTDAGDEIERIMLDWFEEEARRRGCSQFTTGCFEGDEQRMSFLEEGGYKRTEDGDPHLLISLERDAQPPVPPNGYSVRSIEGPHEIEQRAAVHRDAWSTWGPSSLTANVYQKLVRIPGYRQDLDLVALDRDGEFVSCANVWYDEELRVAEFEPVGRPPPNCTARTP